MDKEIERLKREMKNKRKYENFVKQEPVIETKQLKTYFVNYLLKIMVTVVMTLLICIALKSNKTWKAKFYEHVYDTHFDFVTINQIFQKYVGKELPFQSLWQKKSKAVFDEKLEYKESHIYKDGVKLTVRSSYLVPIQQSGIVVFIGEKEGYGNTVIVQQVDGVDLWYGNVENVNLKLYDYVEKGTLLGETKDDTLYLVYKKEGKVLDYKTYLT